MFSPQQSLIAYERAKKQKADQAAATAYAKKKGQMMTQPTQPTKQTNSNPQAGEGDGVSAEQCQEYLKQLQTKRFAHVIPAEKQEIPADLARRNELVNKVTNGGKFDGNR